MIFSLVRWIIAIAIFSICYIFMKKSKILNKRKWVIKWVILSSTLVLFFALLSSALGPIENVFITFPTVESAYNYSNEGKVKHVVEGNETDFVIADKDNSNIIAIIPKTSNGWKTATGLHMKMIASTVTNSALICVYQYKNSDEYYISVFSSKEGDLDVTDNRNSNFDRLRGNSKINKIYYSYYSYIDGFDENYVITVEGQPISFYNTH